MSAKDLADFITMRAKELKLPIAMITKKAGISRQTWHRLKTAQAKQVWLETLEGLAFALKVSLNKLIVLYTHKQNFRSTPLVNTYLMTDYPPFLTEITPNLEDVLVNQEEIFKKNWVIINKGNAAFFKKRLICIDESFEISEKDGNPCFSNGLTPLQNSLEIPALTPKAETVVSTLLCAPKKPGTIISHWKIVDEQGKACFPDNQCLLSFQIIVI